jgi:hypothetical protein
MTDAIARDRINSELDAYTEVHDPSVRVVSGKLLWAMKRKAQARDHELAACGDVPAEAMLLLRPKRLEGARIEWPDTSLTDD